MKYISFIRGVYLRFTWMKSRNVGILAQFFIRFTLEWIIIKSTDLDKIIYFDLLFIFFHLFAAN